MTHSLCSGVHTSYVRVLNPCIVGSSCLAWMSSFVIFCQETEESNAGVVVDWLMQRDGDNKELCNATSAPHSRQEKPITAKGKKYRYCKAMHALETTQTKSDGRKSDCQTNYGPNPSRRDVSILSLFTQNIALIPVVACHIPLIMGPISLTYPTRQIDDWAADPPARSHRSLVCGARGQKSVQLSMHSKDDPQRGRMNKRKLLLFQIPYPPLKPC